jgi:transcriptional regulator GlxA family with amidase domain
MKLGMPIYEGVNLLDVAGPLEMFYWAGRSPRNSLETVLVSEHGRGVTSINGVRFEAQASFAEALTLDILWVPGGSITALQDIMRDPNSAYLEYLRQVAVGATWVCSVCEGALLLARAGLLDGYRATTHWQFVQCLQRFPEIDVDSGRKRFLVSENRLTGGGVSSGLDESLELIRLLFGGDTAEEVQRITEYFPRPPVIGELPAEAPLCIMNWD